MKPMTKLSCILILLLAGGAVFAFGPRVVATTPWTAAFAAAAGAEEVTTLAPYDMLHAAEYELRITDLIRIRNADLIVYAGYEAMMDRLRQAMGTAIPSVQIVTNFNLQVLHQSIMGIAQALGTEEIALENYREITEFISDWREEVQHLGLSGTPVLVHLFQMALIEELGFTVAGSFGPTPLEAQQIVRLSRTGAEYCIDNWHNEAGTPLKETIPGLVYTSWINLPGKAGTRTLMDVLRYNRELFREVFVR